MQRGYFKVWRKIEDSGLFQMPSTLALFMFILSKAAHKPKKIGTPNGVIELQRGQYISGRRKLAIDLEQSEKQIRTSLDRLKEMGILGQQTASKFSVYTIVNYDIYQGEGQQEDEYAASKGPAKGQQRATKEELKNLSIEEEKPKQPSAPSGAGYSQAFLTFWEMYPNKKAKADAAKAFKKIRPDDYPVVKSALQSAIESEDWKRDGGKYIPHPATWINGRRWEDEAVQPEIAPVIVRPVESEEEAAERKAKRRAEQQAKLKALLAVVDATPRQKNPWEVDDEQAA